MSKQHYISDRRARAQTSLFANDPVYSIIAAAIILAAFALRAYNLGTQSFWDDEGYTLLSPDESRWDIPSAMPVGTFSLYYHLVHAWMGIAGGDELAVRYPSLLAAVALVAVVFALGRRIGGAKIAAAAASLAAISPPLIYHSQSARPYTLVTLLMALNFYASLRIRSDPKAIRWWALAIGAFIAAAYSHLYALAGLPAMLLVLVWMIWQKRTPPRHLVLSLGCIFLALTPWLVNSFASTYHRVAARVVAGPLSPLGFADELWIGLFLGETRSTSATSGSWPGAALGLAILIGAFALWRRSNSLGAAAMIYGLAPTLAGYFIQFAIPYFAGRYLLFVAPGIYVVVAGVLSFQRKLQTAILIIPLLVFLVAWAPRAYEQAFPASQERLDSLAMELRQRAQPGDVLISNSEWRQMSLDYYLRGIGIQVVTIPSERPTPVEDVRNQVRAVMENHPRVWLAFFGVSPENVTHSIGPTLSESYAQVSLSWYGTTQLALYEQASDLPANRQQANVVFGDALELVDYRLPPVRSVKPGGTAVVSLRWLLHRQEDYGLSLRLIDERGEVWEQTDSRPRNGYLQTNLLPAPAEIVEARGLTIPWAIPRGIYSLGISVYNAESKNGLGAKNADGQAIPQVLVLGSIEVTRGDSDPPLEAIPIGKRMVKDLGAIRLLGGRWAERVSAGQHIELELLLQAQAELGEGDGLEAELVDDGGKTWGKTKELVGGQAIPANADGTTGEQESNKWLPGEVRRDRLRLRVSPAAPAGHYQVQLHVLRADQRDQRLSRRGTVALGLIEVESRQRRFTAPTMERVSGARFGGQVELLGYDLSGRKTSEENAFLVRAGDQIQVRLYWRANEDLGTYGVERDYTVFVQLLDADGHLVAQHDGMPEGGAAPTTTWAPGEVIEDLHLLSLPSDLKNGIYPVIAGLYDGATVERLLTESGDHVVLGQVLVQ